MRSVALAAVILGVLVQVPLLVAQTGKESQPLVPVTNLPPQDGAVSAPAPAASPAPAPVPAPQAPAPSEPPSPEPPPLVPSDQVAAGTAPALEPAENLEPAPAAEPLGELAQAGPEEPAPEDPEDDEPTPPEEDETDPEEFEREFEDVPEEEMPPLMRNPLVPTATATAGGLPQTGSEIVVLELMGGLLMGVGLALRLALSID